MIEYAPSKTAETVLRNGKILALGETPQQMLTRVSDTLFAVEKQWSTPGDTDTCKQQFIAGFIQKKFSPGTPTLTNAGRYEHVALSSCVVIPVNLRDKETAQAKIRSYYRQNMGSGFDFTPYDDPVALLVWLNEFAAQETATGNYDRYIGNMGSLHVTHPKIKEFIRAKHDRRLIHFNISVDVSEEFMRAANENAQFKLADGSYCNARSLLMEMAECAWYNGDPGIIYLERMNQNNPVAALSSYTSTPPCSEMGLAPGETCQFGYINLAQFVTPTGVNYGDLVQAAEIMTRVLDNAIAVSSDGFPDPESLRLANLKRKIGIGVCGLANVLTYYNLPYASDEARTLARDMLSLINYTSKTPSVKLAETRGSCGAMANRVDNKYYQGFLTDKFHTDTNTVSVKQWQSLDDYIARSGRLRNVTTTALPPTGRASLLMDVTSSIEPHFFEATRINPLDHLKMVAALCGKNGVYDEAASKTINLHHETTPIDVYMTFMVAYYLGLNNISVYRDGSHENQQMKL